MTNLRKLAGPTIYFFEDENNATTSNTLKEFIYFLKFNGKKDIDFSYASESDSLHVNLNIKQNFELDSIPSSLIKDSENNVVDFLKQLKNPFLKELVNKLGNLNRSVAELTANEVKLAALVKAILSKSNYIFLESPEKDIDAQTLNTIKDCIQFEALERERTILIKSKRKVLWPDIITNIVTRNNESHQYINIKNPLNMGHSQNESHKYVQLIPLDKVS